MRYPADSKSCEERQKKQGVSFNAVTKKQSRHAGGVRRDRKQGINQRHYKESHPDSRERSEISDSDSVGADKGKGSSRVEVTVVWLSVFLSFFAHVPAFIDQRLLNTTPVRQLVPAL